MMTANVLTTDQLAPNELESLFRFLIGAYDGDFADEDFEHALGGLHAFIRDGDEWLAHASVVPRMMKNAGRELRTGYVEAVATRHDLRGQGFGAAVMVPLEEHIRSTYDLGCLNTGSEIASFYTRRGWTLWAGTSAVESTDGMEPTPDEDGSIYVLHAAGLVLEPSYPLVCDYRSGDVW